MAAVDTFVLRFIAVSQRLPDDDREVLVAHEGGIDRGRLYGGKTWRLADFSEVELKNVTSWSEMPPRCLLS